MSFSAEGTMIESLESRRLLSAGELDPTFGIGGLRDLDFAGKQDDLRGAALLSDGGIFVAGSNNVGRVEFMKLTPGGALDLSFGGGDGKIATQYEWTGGGVSGRMAAHAPTARFALTLSTDGPLGRPADVL